MIRKIVQIDEEKCDGCGECIPSCAEGAIALVNGKARLSADALCDGLGACLGDCPRGAITVIEREAAAFDEAAVAAHLARGDQAKPGHATHAPRLGVVAEAGPPGGGCPGSRSQTLPRRPLAVAADRAGPPQPAGDGESRLGHWPVQLQLVGVTAPFFQGADLLVAADCVPFAYPRFHQDLLDGKALVVGCPKLDDIQGHAEKLGQILTRNDVRSVTVVRMEVPCCSGIAAAVRQGVAASGKPIPVRDVVIGIGGQLRG